MKTKVGRRVKRPYRPPQVTRYGNVAQLTKTKAGARPDGAPGEPLTKVSGT